MALSVSRHLNPAFNPTLTPKVKPLDGTDEDAAAKEHALIAWTNAGGPPDRFDEAWSMFAAPGQHYDNLKALLGRFHDAAVRVAPGAVADPDTKFHAWFDDLLAKNPHQPKAG